MTTAFIAFILGIGIPIVVIFGAIAIFSSRKNQPKLTKTVKNLDNDELTIEIRTLKQRLKEQINIHPNCYPQINNILTNFKKLLEILQEEGLEPTPAEIVVYTDRFRRINEIVELKNWELVVENNSLTKVFEAFGAVNEMICKNIQQVKTRKNSEIDLNLKMLTDSSNDLNLEELLFVDNIVGEGKTGETIGNIHSL